MKDKFERGLLLSRWLLAPMYLALVGSLLVLLVAGLQATWAMLSRIGSISVIEAILGTLTLLDLSLVASLVVLVIFSGYENFVAPFSPETETERPLTVGFAEMKISLFASIVAISGIHLLKTFMDPTQMDTEQLKWMLLTHLVFVVSTFLIGVMEWMIGRHKGHE